MLSGGIKTRDAGNVPVHDDLQEAKSTPDGHSPVPSCNPSRQAEQVKPGLMAGRQFLDSKKQAHTQGPNMAAEGHHA